MSSQGIGNALTPIAKSTFLVAALCMAAFSSAQLRSLDSTRDGRGTLSYRTRSSASTVRRVRVNLKENGRAEISILSGANETFSGTWHASGLTKVYLDIDRVGRDRATGTGQVVHDARGEFASVFCNGTVGRSHFDLRFDAKVNRPPWWEGGHEGGAASDKMFLANAHSALADRFRNYDLSYSHETVGREILGNRTVKGKFRARGRGLAAATYDYVVVCGAKTGDVKSVHYTRK